MAVPRVDPARVAEVEARRRRADAAVRTVSLRAAPATVDLGGPVVQTWAYGGRVPGPPVRVTAGDVLRVEFHNGLPEPTSVHWHGLAVRNDMDGVPDTTQPAVPPGDRFGYEFTVPDPGTYWLHPHMGLQLDRGLYAPLIVDDPHEPGGYDLDETVVFDDWLDGVAGRSPEVAYAALRRSTGMMGGGGVDHPYHLADGRIPASPRTTSGRPGQRLRLRLVNAASDTVYRIALGGHRVTVTHTDGFPVRPVEADAVELAMGERLDLRVALQDGAFPLVAAAVGKAGTARVIIRTGRGAPPVAGLPAELHGRVATGTELTAADAVRLPAAAVDRTRPVHLGGGMHGYVWTINARTADHAEPLLVTEGERVALDIVNATMSAHPVHLHGHTMQVGSGGARKDTVVMRPNARLTALLRADNPGAWMLHCHNTYHAEAGMMTVLAYR